MELEFRSMVREGLFELSLGGRKLLTENSIRLRNQQLQKPYAGNELAF